MDDIEDLDDSWLQEFEKIDNEYKNYYTEDLSFIRIHCIYINNQNEIEKVSESTTFLKTPGTLQKEELISLIKHHSFLHKIKYSLFSILKFNISLEPIHLKTFLRNNNLQLGSQFLQSVKTIDTIKFDKSIAMFHDINEILLLFHNKSSKPTASTRRHIGRPNHFKKTKKRT